MKIVSTDSLSLRTSHVSGKYTEIMAACGTLKTGQSIVIETPADEKKGTKGYRNKLSYKIRNIPTPSGTFLRVRASADDKSVAISLVTGSKPARNPNLTGKPKPKTATAGAKK